MGICSSKSALDVNVNARKCFKEFQQPRRPFSRSENKRFLISFLPSLSPTLSHSHTATVLKKDVTFKDDKVLYQSLPVTKTETTLIPEKVIPEKQNLESNKDEDPSSLEEFYNEAPIIKRLHQVLQERENISGETTLPSLQESTGPNDVNWRERAQILFRMVDVNGRGALTRRDCADAIRLFLDSAYYHPDVKKQGLLEKATNAELDAAVQQVTESLWTFGVSTGSISFAKFVSFLSMFMGINEEVVEEEEEEEVEEEEDEDEEEKEKEITLIH
jgi:hypothetical protein